MDFELGWDPSSMHCRWLCLCEFRNMCNTRMDKRNFPHLPRQTVMHIMAGFQGIHFFFHPAKKDSRQPQQRNTWQFCIIQKAPRENAIRHIWAQYCVGVIYICICNLGAFQETQGRRFAWVFSTELYLSSFSMIAWIFDRKYRKYRKFNEIKVLCEGQYWQFGSCFIILQTTHNSCTFMTWCVGREHPKI